jgi:2-keto-3-deoxy-L-rhamnonate aldolase RhmA
MNGRELRDKWRAGLPTAGIWMRLSDPTVAEIIGPLGLDWVLVDVEHSALDLQTLQALMIALHDSATVPLVRVPWNDFVFIKRVLDLGAEGVLVPHVGSAEEAEAAVRACKYPPQGNRGTGPRRPSHYGARERQYLAEANERTVALVMIETAAAVRDIDRILAASELDGIVVGPVDLAASMGLLPDFEHPDVEAAIETVIARARAARVPFGTGRSVQDATPWLQRGAQIIPIGDDEAFIQRGVQTALRAFRRAASPVKKG